MRAAFDHGDLVRYLDQAGVDAWGAARVAPAWALAPPLPFAVSLALRLRPGALEGVEDGPTPAYHDEYLRANHALNAIAAGLQGCLRRGGHRAEHVPALVVDREEPVADWGQAGLFAHKTAATQAGLGWIGKTALFVSPTLGPKLRLATVFTDMALPPGTPVTGGRCGRCRRCVDACPAGAGRDVRWRAGMPRAELYDEKACEAQLDRYDDLGGICGICVAVCPFGRDD